MYESTTRYLIVLTRRECAAGLVFWITALWFSELIALDSLTDRSLTAPINQLSPQVRFWTLTSEGTDLYFSQRKINPIKEQTRRAWGDSSRSLFLPTRGYISH